MTCQYATICHCCCGASIFRHVRNLYQGSISPCSATWTLKTRSKTEEELSNGLGADVFYFSKKRFLQLFLDSGTCALWMRYLLRTAVSLEASIQDPPSDTFWWIEGCACRLLGVSVIVEWKKAIQTTVASKTLLALLIHYEKVWLRYRHMMTYAKHCKTIQNSLTSPSHLLAHVSACQNSLSQSLDNCVIFLFWLKIYKLLMMRAPS